MFNLKTLISLMDSVGALKWMKSSKATLSVAGVSAIVLFVNDAMVKEFPWQVVCATVLGMSMLSAALVLAQGKVDEAKQFLSNMELSNITPIAVQPNNKETGMKIPSGVIAILLILGLTTQATCGGVTVVGKGNADCGAAQNVTLNIFDACNEIPIGKPAAITLVDTSETPNTVVTVRRTAGAGHYEALDVQMCETTYKGSLTVAGYQPINAEMVQFYNTYYDLFLVPVDKANTPFNESECQTGVDAVPDSNLALRAGFCSCLVQNSYDTVNPSSGDMLVCCNNPFMNSLAGYAGLCAGTSVGALSLPSKFCEGF